MSNFKFSFARLNTMLAKIAKRASITPSDIDSQLTFRVSSEGVVVDVLDADGNPVQSMAEPGTVLQRKIWNVDAINAVALRKAENLELLKEGQKLEAAGQFEEAHEAYRTFFNRVTLSFSALLPLKPEFENLGTGDRVKGVIAAYAGRNGATLIVEDPRPVTAARTTGIDGFSLSTLLGAAEGTPEADELLKGIIGMEGVDDEEKDDDEEGGETGEPEPQA